MVILSAVRPHDSAYHPKVKLLAQLVDRHYMVLRLQGCYDSNSFTRQITSLVINLRDKDDLAEIKQDFDNNLIGDINKTRSANVTELFNYGFFKDTKVNSSNKTFIRYLLARIEEFLCLEMNYSNFAGYNNLCVGKKYHIEHILANNDENKNVFGNEDFFNEQRDRLGGLLLLKKGDNGMSLAEVYADKLKTYTNDTNFARTLTEHFYHNNSGLKLLKDKYPLINLSPIHKFDETALDDRHALIYEICKTIWSDNYISSN
jgi:hypothetical protein